MKKLMFAAVAAAVTTGAYAIPTVYDYKASVKHMYLKEVNVRGLDGALTAADPVPIYQKYTKSASLKGYLIMDSDGATSQTIVNDRADGNSNGATGFDYGRNRGFLVVMNSKSERTVRFPKIMPAVLDAKWIDTAWKKGHEAKSGIAEGTLFAGGDSVACVRTQFDDLTAGVTDRGTAPGAPAANAAGMSAYADYVWTSVYLFGEKNGPNWFLADAATGTHAFDAFETAWDNNLPADLKLDIYTAGTGANVITDGRFWNVKQYHDTWLNGAGFGKWSKNSTSLSGNYCCGIVVRPTTNWDKPVLETLSGNLKGGIFLCTENGIGVDLTSYSFWDGILGGASGWEDQFNTTRLVPGVTFADSMQNDMWQDGAVEQETTDVVFGTWSIKRNANFFSARAPIFRAITAAEMEALSGVPGATLEDATGLADLCGAIKGAALKLSNRSIFCDGRETAIDMMPGTQFANWPLVTPKFAKYYGLANFK